MKNTHLEHAEDTILTGDLSVLDWFTAGGHLSVKIDGAPAIVWGIDPATGTFFVGTKAVFNKKKIRKIMPFDINGNILTDSQVKYYNETTKLKLNYDILNSASKFRMFKPCVKHYLTGQLKTRLVYINPTEWDVALFLPTARFVGATQAQVFKDSRKIIRG